MKTDNTISQSAIYNFIKACEEHSNINLINLVLLQGDDVLAQFCKKPYKKDCKQLLFSMTKSFTSLAVGIAVDNGLLQLDDYVVSFFKDDLPQNPHANLMKMQVRHLLTMTTGINENTYTELFPQPNWIKAFLAQEFPHEPGTYYKYSTHATHMLSAIIQKTSGQSLEEFLNMFMFFPMNITEAEWELSPEGLTAGGMGLSLYPSSLIKFASLLLNKGHYQGKRIISEKYLSRATSPQAIKQDDINNENKLYSGYQYGFQFHIMQNGCYRADGAFGQFCIVCPDKNIAVIATSQHTKTENFLALIDKYIISQQKDDDIMPRDYIENYLSTLSLVLPEQSNIEYHLQTGKYTIDKNELHIKEIEFAVKCDLPHLKFIYEDSTEDIIELDLLRAVYGKSYFIKDLQIHLQEHCSYARWIDPNTLKLTIYYIETPYVAEYVIHFCREMITLDFKVNVSMTLKGFSVNGLKLNDTRM